MADEQLKLVAAVEDKFSGPLKALRDQLAAIKGAPGAKALKGDFAEAHAALSKVSNEIKSSLTPALSALGIGSLGAAGAIGGVVAAVKGMTGSVTELRTLSKETGASVEELRKLEALGKRFGVEGGALGGSVKAFSDQMEQFKRNAGEAFEWLRTFGPTHAPDLWKGLLDAKNMDQAIEAAVDGLAKIENPRTRRVIADHLGLGSLGGAFAEGSEGLKKLRKAIDENLGSLPEGAVESARKFKEGFDSLGESLIALRDRAIGPLLPEFTKLTDGVREFVQSHEKDIGEGIKNLGLALSTTDWRTVGADITESLREIGRLAGYAATAIGFLLDKGKDVFDAGRATRGFVDRALGVTTPAGESAKKQKQVDALDDIIKNEAGTSNADQARRKRDQLIDEMRRLAEEMKRTREGAEFQKQSFDGSGVGGGLGGLVQKANLGGGGGRGGGGVPHIRPGGRMGGIDLGGGGGRGSAGSQPGDEPVTGGTGSPGREEMGPPAPGGGGVPRISPRAPAPTMESLEGSGRAARKGAHYSNEMATAIRQSAKDLGVSPRDLATMISFETIGSFNPNIKGGNDSKGRKGQYLGLIQFSPENQKKYGVRPGMPVGEQMKAVTQYLRDRGVKPGMPGMNVYAAVNAGHASKIHASDARNGGTWGTVADKWNHQMAGHRRNADRLLAQGEGGSKAAGVPENWFGKSMGKVGGGQPLEANGTVNVHVHGPSGTRTKTDATGLFKEVNVHRGRSMAQAEHGPGGP